MLEARASVLPGVTLMLDGEDVLRMATAGDAPERVVYHPEWGRAPGVFHALYYRAGLQVTPWRGLPHRLGVYGTNRRVPSGRSIHSESKVRFERGSFVVVEAEAFL